MKLPKMPILERQLYIITSIQKEEIFVELLNNGWEMIWESIEEEVHDNENPKETFINSLNIIGGLIRKNQILLNFCLQPLK